MAAPRRVSDLVIGEEELAELEIISRSRTEPAGRVCRARMLLAYREDPSFFAVGVGLGVHHQTVQRCVARAMTDGALAALEDRARPGREPVITQPARAWLIDLACRKAKELGYPHEVWTTRLLAQHARQHGPAAGHACLADLSQGTVCKILDAGEVKPHKVRYYLERRDPEFAEKMAEVLCVYREVKLLKKRTKSADPVAIVSYDEKPGVQAIGVTAPDLPPVPGIRPTVARDHEYKRHGTVSLLAGIDLLTGKVHALVKDRHRSREFIEFLKLLDVAYPTHTAIKVFSTITPRTSPKKPAAGSLLSDQGASSLSSHRRTVLGSTSSKPSSPRSPARCCARFASHPSRNSRIVSRPQASSSIISLSSTPGPTYAEWRNLI
jgi:transposase